MVTMPNFDGYKHYIRIDANNIVIYRFSDAFEQPQVSDICVAEDAGRHYNDPYTNDRGQYIYRWNGTDQILRDQTELDAEWAARPPEPPSLQQQLSDLQDAFNALLMG